MNNIHILRSRMCCHIDGEYTIFTVMGDEVVVEEYEYDHSCEAVLCNAQAVPKAEARLIYSKLLKHKYIACDSVPDPMYLVM